MVDRPASPWYYAGVTGGITDTTAVDISPVAVVGQKHFLTNLTYHNTAAAASEIVIQNKSDSAIRWRGYANATMTSLTWVEFDPPLQSLANDVLQVKMITTATATRVSAQGFTDA